MPAEIFVVRSDLIINSFVGKDFFPSRCEWVSSKCNIQSLNQGGDFEAFRESSFGLTASILFHWFLLLLLHHLAVDPLRQHRIDVQHPQIVTPSSHLGHQRWRWWWYAWLHMVRKKWNLRTQFPPFLRKILKKYPKSGKILRRFNILTNLEKFHIIWKKY